MPYGNIIRDNDFTQSQLRGIELVVKSISKRYPFIEGWRFEKDWEKWLTGVYIDIKVDWNKVFKFYNTKVSPKWENYLRLDKEGYSSSLLLTFTDLNPLSEDPTLHNEFFEYNFNTTLKLRNLASSLYENLPEELSIFYGYDDNPNYKVRCRLNVTSFYT